MYLDSVGAVFHIVIFTDRGGRQFALFADEDKSLVQMLGQWSAQQETARFDDGDAVDRHVAVMADQLVNSQFQSIGVVQQRGDIPELHTLLGIVRNGADV